MNNFLGKYQLLKLTQGMIGLDKRITIEKTHKCESKHIEQIRANTPSCFLTELQKKVSGGKITFFDKWCRSSLTYISLFAQKSTQNGSWT